MAKPTTTIETLTDNQIIALRSAAAAHGDLAQVAVCDGAITGEDDARAECVRVIRDGEAQQ